MKKHVFYWLALGLMIITGCQKELSFELGDTPGKGSLQSDVSGDCLPKTINGTYIAGTALVPATNTITVQVNVLQTGTYVITTDTVNGYYFRGTGTFTTLGATNITLRGNGTPFTDGIDNFVVSFDGTICDIAVTVLPVGSGPAVFTLAGAPGSCTTPTVNGTYATGVALTPANTVVLNVNVTTAGTYNVTAGPVNGMTFTGTGTLAIGAQTITLIGTAASIPTTAGTNTIPVTVGTTTCSFTVTVGSPAVFTIDCPNVVVNGTYQTGVNLGASNTIVIPVTVTTAGPYNISASVNGMTFSGSGNLLLTTTSITLTGVATTSPTNTGTFNLSVGTPACSIPITCTAGPVIDWKFNIGTTVYQGSTDQVDFDNTSLPPFILLDYLGTNLATDEFSFSLIDLAGGMLANETYNSTSVGLTNIAAFYFIDGAGTIDLTADPGPPAVGNMVFRITSHNTATKTIVGTFSGTAFDAISSTTKTITNGTFTLVYP